MLSQVQMQEYRPKDPLYQLQHRYKSLLDDKNIAYTNNKSQVVEKMVFNFAEHFKTERIGQISNVHIFIPSFVSTIISFLANLNLLWTIFVFFIQLINACWWLLIFWWNSTLSKGHLFEEGLQQQIRSTKIVSVSGIRIRIERKLTDKFESSRLKFPYMHG